MTYPRALRGLRGQRVLRGLPAHASYMPYMNTCLTIGDDWRIVNCETANEPNMTQTTRISMA